MSFFPHPRLERRHQGPLHESASSCIRLQQRVDPLSLVRSSPLLLTPSRFVTEARRPTSSKPNAYSHRLDSGTSRPARSSQRSRATPAGRAASLAWDAITLSPRKPAARRCTSGRGTRYQHLPLLLIACAAPCVDQLCGHRELSSFHDRHGRHLACYDGFCETHRAGVLGAG